MAQDSYETFERRIEKYFNNDPNTAKLMGEWAMELLRSGDIRLPGGKKNRGFDAILKEISEKNIGDKSAKVWYVMRAFHKQFITECQGDVNKIDAVFKLLDVAFGEGDLKKAIKKMQKGGDMWNGYKGEWKRRILLDKKWREFCEAGNADNADLDD